MSGIRLLLDQNLTPRLVPELGDVGVAAEHVLALGMAGWSDPQILDYARAERLTILTADSDFGKLLARSRAHSPSVILLRHGQPYEIAPLAAQIALVVPNVSAELGRGCLLTLDETSMRLRDLPL